MGCDGSRPADCSSRAVLRRRRRGPAPIVVRRVVGVVGLQLVLLLTVYSQAQGCVCAQCAALQLAGDVEQPWLISKYDLVHKTGSTLRITAPPEPRP